jgi:hypothetical protein
VRPPRPHFIVTATKAGHTTYLNTDHKFTAREKAARRFSHLGDAVTHRHAMLTRYPHLATWRLDIRGQR